MSLHRSCLTTSLLLLFSVAAQAQISKGQQILIDRGLQVQGLVSRQETDAFHLNTYLNANYTTMLWEWDSRPADMGPAPGFPWARWIGDETQMPPRNGEDAYLSQLVMIQMGDEWELNDDTTRTRLVNWFNSVRTNWPNAILYHNNYGGQVGDSQLFDFYSRAHPDMLCFDSYPFRVDSSNNKYETLANWYGDLRRYRQHAVGAGLPLGTYIQTFTSAGEGFTSPSASELHLQFSAALAFNCKAFLGFTYNSSASVLFDNSASGDNSPNALYYEEADCALRARNFGKALVKLTPVADVSFPDLRTTSMMFIRGHNADGSIRPFPIGFYAGTGGADAATDWAYRRNDPYMTNNWAVTNKGTKNNGQPGDVIISWFKPLDESFDGAEYTNEVYMMVVNGLSDVTGSSADCLQEIKLNFAPSLTAVEMLNPVTGLVEVQPLSLTNGLRQLVLNLNGGDAVLFKFSDGAPFIGSEVTGPPVITSQPIDTTVALGGNATFTARAAGASPLSYQWTFNGVNIPDATTSSYTKGNVQVSDAGNYSVIVSNAFSTATATAALTVGINPPLLYEPFDYTNIGSAVSSNTPANWTYGGAGANDLSVVSGNLVYRGLATSIGNSVTNGGAGLGVRRLLGTNLNSGTVFVSALFSINNLGYGTWNGAATQVGALTTPDNTSFRVQILVKSNSAAGYVIGVQKGGTGSTAVFDTTEYHTNDVIFLVGKFDFAASPNTATLWINPSSATFSSASAPANGFITASSGTDGVTIDRFNIRQNTAASVPAAMQWDELRVGLSWAEVTPLAARFGSINLLQNGQVHLQALGTTGTTSIELSSNLIDWFPLTNFAGTNGAFDYIESTTNAPQRFYRLNLSP